MTIVMNRRIAAVPHLDSFLADHPCAVAGWECKLSGRMAGWPPTPARRAQGRGVTLEDVPHAAFTPAAACLAGQRRADPGMSCPRAVTSLPAALGQDAA
jgi:hypothetical protein